MARKRLVISKRDVHELYDVLCRVLDLVDPPSLVVLESLDGDKFGDYDDDVIRVGLKPHRYSPISYLIDTLLHELAHHMTDDSGHDEKWQRMARRLGAFPTYRGLRV